MQRPHFFFHSPQTPALTEPCRAQNLFGKQGTWEFKHERKEQRNYALLDVIVDKDEEGDESSGMPPSY